MLDRYERPLKILCLGMAALVVWQLASLVFRGDPLKHLKIPALPELPAGTNEEAKISGKETNAVARTGPTNRTNGINVAVATAGTNTGNRTNIASQTNAIKGTNLAQATNPAKGTNIASVTNLLKGTNVAKSTNLITKGPKGPPNMPGGPPGRGRGGAK